MKLTSTLIRLGTGSTMVLFGLTQIVRPDGWHGYVPKWSQRLLNATPLTETRFMRLHGGFNVVAGLWYASGRYPTASGLTSLGWWASISPFAVYYDWRDGLRDMSIMAAIAAELASRRD